MSEPHDDGGPIQFQPSVHAPWTPSQVRAIEAWQKAGTVHPLTCQESEHGALFVTSEHLVCDTCGYEQTWVPRMCAETFPGDYAPSLPPTFTGKIVMPPPTEAEIKRNAERAAALVIAIRLMEMHLEMATPGGAGRDSIAWTVAQRRLTVLRELLAEIRATQPEQPSAE